MPKQIDKETYVKVKGTYKHPIQRMHALYNMHCDTNMRVGSMAQFEGYLQIWFGNQGYQLLQGCLIIQKRFDSQFAQ